MRPIGMALALTAIVVGLALAIGDALAQQPTPEQTIQVQQQMIQRANACVDVYRERDAVVAQANERIAALTKELEALKKPEKK